MSTTWINRGHLYAPHVTPVIADLAFTVDNTNGLGITGLVGQAAQSVFMHTTTTPSRAPNGQLNPNPEVGVILVQLSDNFTRVYSAIPTIVSPNSGSSLNVDASDAALTVGKLYVIQTLGTTTAADWRALGLPAGIIPAVGASFVALVTGSGTGTGTVQLPAAAGSTINHIEMVGKPHLMLGPTPVGGSPNVGAWVMLRTLAATNSTTTTLVNTAPAAGTVIKLALYLNQSSVTVAGE